MRMIASRVPSRSVAFLLVLSLSPLALLARSLPQDITGGSSSELASATEVEGRTGKGIFSAPKSVAHHPRKLEQKIVARATSSSRPQRETVSGAGRETSGGSDDQSKPLGSTPPLGGAARRVAGPEELNKQGDDAFD